MHFVLVHGAYHGSWCWDALRGELDRGGHSSSAVDLPCEDPDAGAERYADEVVGSIPRTADGVVLVGHSLAGLTIPIVAGRIRTAMTIYLCAMLPVPGLSFDDQHVDFGTGFQPSDPPISLPDGSTSWPERGAVEMFFHDCDPTVAAAAARKLRPQQWRVTQEVTPLRAWRCWRRAWRCWCVTPRGRDLRSGMPRRSSPVSVSMSSFGDFNRTLINDLRAHGGKPTSGPFLGRDVLILTTKGAKSGKSRENPLVYTRDGKNYVVLASKGGAPTNPSWYHNLVTHPDVTVEVLGKKFNARAQAADGDEYERLYAQHAGPNPTFNDYRTRTTRKIPVIVLEALK